jgi:uncharacterized protein
MSRSNQDDRARLSRQPMSDADPALVGEDAETGLTRRALLQALNAGVLAAGAGALSPVPAWAAATGDAATGMGPRKVKSVEDVWIPMSDGTRIAARLWLPEDAERHPVPALMEYIPYRHRDSTRLGDETRHPYYASYGYACLRPDIRGSGNSDGLPQDEYVKKEQDDGVEIIAWLARQPWCMGKVGLFGISWGGFSALQLAARHPPALKAIITHCSTDDRYTDDAHYLGGCIVSDMFGWGSEHTTYTMRPPDPAIVGPQWREQWKSRLEALDFYVGNWLAHPHRDAFWKHGSVNEDYRQITCAVYAVGGWVDSYHCAVPRLLAGLKVPRKGLIGPWSHRYPHQGFPGPAIDWLKESLRWWDHWLKGADTGIMAEPMYRVWMQDGTAMASTDPDLSIAGRWVAEDVWPSSRIQATSYYLNADHLGPSAGPEQALTLEPLQTVGITAPHWCAFNMATELPTDQRIDDARSLAFDSAPLRERLEILGRPIAQLELSVDKPVAFLAVRLNELTADGVSRRITYGLLNLCQRDSNESPQPLEPGRRYRLRIPLMDIAHAFKPGSRLRVALSTTYWPLIWPSPEPVKLSLVAGASWIELPVRPPRPEDAHLAPFGPAYVPETSGVTVLEAGGAQTKIYDWNVGTRSLTIRSEGPYSRRRLNATGTELSSSWHEVLEIRDDDPTSAQLEYARMIGYSRTGWDTRVESVLKFSLTPDRFLLKGEIKAFDGGVSFFTRNWERSIPRDLL